MADFRPETEVTLYAGTCVDDENQPFFSTEAAKMSWYNSHLPRTYTAYSYQRENRNYVRVEDKAETLRAYDMMSFKNSDGRNVLCRIEEVEFINPNCAEIRYTVDYMQTYIDQVQFGKCWVEREMQDDDWDGSRPSFNNLQPEGIETGAMTRTRVSDSDLSFDSFDLIVVSAYDGDGEPNYEIKTVNYYPTGLNYIRFALTRFGTVGALGNMLKTYAQKGIDVSNAIVGMFVVPHEYSGGSSIGSKTIPITPPYPTINGYQVINAKCFTSEFFTLELSNRRGVERELKPENFTETDNITLILSYGLGAGGGGSMLYPQSYEGNPKDFAVLRTDDAQAACTSNAFAEWLAANSTQLAGNVISGVGRAVITGAMVAGTGGGALAGLIGGASAESAALSAGIFAGKVSAASSAGQTIAKIMDKAKDPSGLVGQMGGTVMEILMDNYGFSVNWVHPYTANLRSIDQYFSRFGYRTNRYKYPNVNTRPKWNYVKTAGAVCRGPFPKRAQLIMESMMDNGVTFWHLGGGENINDDWDPVVNKQ